ncbi:hypothetical protein WJX73_000447 [Symbiochloris irregularis]|uniref:Tetratricopeptide repeat protein n=1 Tax=Symbiochloris irregularis TaxID=706552 RepID=A0AAW1P757_9CHLO
MPEATGTFSFVYIPARLQAPVEAWTQDYTESRAVECLFDRIKAHYARTKPQKTPEQQKAQMQQLLSSIPEDQRRNIDHKVLSMASDLNMVENVALLSNAADNNFVGVNLYCADDATFTGAERNQRASEIASCCGKALEVNGDAFLARVFDNGDDFERRDFDLNDVSSTAAWVKQARAQNERKRRAEDPAAALQRIQQQADRPKAEPSLPPPPAKPVSASEQARLQGNDAFKQGDYAQALECYDEACTADGAGPAAFNNRALTHLKLGQLREAEADCDSVLEREPKNVKALLRRAAARRGLHEDAKALGDYQQVLQQQPNNAEARKGRDEIQGRSDDSSPAGEGIET